MDVVKRKYSGEGPCLIEYFSYIYIMMNLNSDERYFAESIDCIVAVGDFEAFVNKNRKLYDLYRLLTGYGLYCEYEYAYHDEDEVIPGISFPEYRDEDGPDNGLPGIIVTCENGELHLRATPYYSGIKQAIEFEIPLNEDDMLMIFEPNEDLNYFSNIFSTESVEFMYHYICALSDLMFEDGAYLIPFSKDKVSVYWTKLFADGNLSYDRFTSYEIIPKKDDDWEFCVSYQMTIDEEKKLGELYACVKEIVSDIQQSYKKLLNDKK